MWPIDHRPMQPYLMRANKVVGYCQCREFGTSTRQLSRAVPIRTSIGFTRGRHAAGPGDEARQLGIARVRVVTPLAFGPYGSNACAVVRRAALGVDSGTDMRHQEVSANAGKQHALAAGLQHGPS